MRQPLQMTDRVGHPDQPSDALPAVDRALLEQSVTKIQAGVRGYLVRKKQRQEKEAAVKIQAGFRGFRARKEMKNAMH